MVVTIETQPRIVLRFAPGRPTWLALGACGALLLAGILAAVALGAAWGSSTSTMTGSFGGQEFNQETTSRYEMFEGTSQAGSVDYSDSDLDEQDGIGMVRAAGPLAITGLVLSFLGFLVVGASAFVHGLRLGLIGGLVGALAFVCLLLAAILLPLGLDELHEPGTSNQGGFTMTTSDIRWGAGLVIGIIATVAAAAGGALGLLSLRAGPRPAAA